MDRISWVYRGDTKGYHISLDGKQVHFAKSGRNRDMFIAELKTKMNSAPSFDLPYIPDNDEANRIIGVLVDALEDYQTTNSIHNDTEAVLFAKGESALAEARNKPKEATA